MYSLKANSGIPNSIIVDKGENYVIVGYSNGWIRLFDLKKQQIIAYFRVDTEPVTKLVWSRDDHKIFAFSPWQHIVEWSLPRFVY